MKATTKVLLEKFAGLRLRPNRVTHGEDGKTRFTWYVDDDDDRYVELVDSSRVHHGSGVMVMLTVRDGWRGEARVVEDQDLVVKQVVQYLRILSPEFVP